VPGCGAGLSADPAQALDHAHSTPHGRPTLRPAGGGGSARMAPAGPRSADQAQPVLPAARPAATRAAPATGGLKQPACSQSRLPAASPRPESPVSTQRCRLATYVLSAVLTTAALWAVPAMAAPSRPEE